VLAGGEDVVADDSINVVPAIAKERDRAGRIRKASGDFILALG
jgi:hypothetical protein